MSKSKLKKNAVFNSASFVFISAVNFLTLPYIVSKMNLEVFGIYTLLSGLFGYFGIFDFGLGQGLIKFISEYNETRQFKKISLSINSCLWFQVAIGLLLGTILFFLAPNVIRLFNVSPEYFLESVEALKIALVGLFISFISAVFSSTLMGLQRYDLTSTVDSIINFLLNGSLVVFLFYSKITLTQALLLSVLFSFLSLITYASLIYKNIPNYNLKLEIDFLIIKGFIKYSINIFLSKLSSLFSTYLVRFILAYFLTPVAVTFFVVPSKLLGAIGGVLSSGSNAIFPYISSLQANKNTEAIKRSFFQGSTLFAAISIPVLVFCILYSKQILTVWMGNDFANDTWLILSIISLSSLIASASTIPNLILMGMGNSRLIAFFSVVSITFYIIFLPSLTRLYGLTGAAAALLITSSISIVFVLKYSLNYMRIAFVEYVDQAYSKHLWPLIIFSLFTAALYMFIPIEAIYFLVVGAIFLSLYYFFIYSNVYLKLGKGDLKFSTLSKES